MMSGFQVVTIKMSLYTKRPAILSGVQNSQIRVFRENFSKGLYGRNLGLADVSNRDSYPIISDTGFLKASVTIRADFSPEFNPPVRWRSKHQTKIDC